MNKDVIYIDVEDDITAIIGKIKASDEKVVALVPPKHAGILQSAVNLRLLDRMAKAEKKNLVVVTNNQALVALAANARIPVAKNLQSKPELPEIPALAVDEGDDIIDGSELPVGEHARETASTAKKPKSQPAVSHIPTRTDSLETLAIDGEEVKAPAAAPIRVRKAAKPEKGTKIPNFKKFRKRLVLIIIAVIVVAGALVWAYGFAPAATIIITANTTPMPVTGTLKLGGSAATNFTTGVVSSQQQQIHKNITVQFTPTGQKNIGQPATGVATLSTDSIDELGATVPAGTTLTASGGLAFTTDAAVTFTFSNHSGVPVNVTATANGTQYNGVSGNLSGAGDEVNATMSTATSGGTSQEVTVVQASDLQTALNQAVSQSTNGIQQQLTTQFGKGVDVISDSFDATQGTPTSSPAVGQQLPSGQSQATLTVPMAYTMYGIPQSALTSYLTQNLDSQIGNQKNQKIYDTGLSAVSFNNFVNADGQMTVNLITTGQVGPVIDAANIKSMVKGMKAGSVQGALQGIDGIQSVQVNFSHFWVHRVPNDTNKITVEFKLKNG